MYTVRVERLNVPSVQSDQVARSDQTAQEEASAEVNVQGVQEGRATSVDEEGVVQKEQSARDDGHSEGQTSELAGCESEGDTERVQGANIGMELLSE